MCTNSSPAKAWECDVVILVLDVHLEVWELKLSVLGKRRRFGSIYPTMRNDYYDLFSAIWIGICPMLCGTFRYLYNTLSTVDRDLPYV